MGNVSAVFALANSPVPVGTFLAYGGAQAPPGFLLCDGASYATTAYPDLFAVIQYQYGGSGASFNVPDLRGRTVIGAGSDGTAANGVARARGDKSGDTRLQSHTHTGTTGTMNSNWSHQHYVTRAAFPYADSGTIRNGNFGVGTAGANYVEWQGAYVGATDTNHTHNFTTADHNQSIGAGANMPPFGVGTYVIKAINDVPRTGLTGTGSTVALASALPSSPVYGQEAYTLSAITGRYVCQVWDGAKWVYVTPLLQTVLTQHSSATQNGGAGSNYSIYAGLTTTITTHGNTRLIVDGCVNSCQPSTANSMGIVKCDYDSTSIDPAVTTNIIAGASAEWAHNGYDLKNLPFSGQTGVLAAGTYTFRVKVRSPQAVTLQWNWHSYTEQRSWLKLTEVAAV